MIAAEPKAPSVDLLVQPGPGPPIRMGTQISAGGATRRIQYQAPHAEPQPGLGVTPSLLLACAQSPSPKDG